MISSSLLDQPAIRMRALRFSVEQYHLLGESGFIPEKVELLDGIIVEKVSKSPLHSRTAQRLIRALRAVLPPDLDVRQEQPITSYDSEPEPDFAVVPARADDYGSGHPTTAKLVIEVAVSSAEFDHQKRAIYAAANVQEYWIVLPESRSVEVYTGPADGDYLKRQSFVEPQIVASEQLPSFQLSLMDLFR